MQTLLFDSLVFWVADVSVKEQAAFMKREKELWEMMMLWWPRCG